VEVWSSGGLSGIREEKQSQNWDKIEQKCLDNIPRGSDLTFVGNVGTGGKQQL
jgi:hypothetical protein